MAQSVWGEAGSHGNLGFLIVEVKEEGGVGRDKRRFSSS